MAVDLGSMFGSTEEGTGLGVEEEVVVAGFGSCSGFCAIPIIYILLLLII